MNQALYFTGYKNFEVDLINLPKSSLNIGIANQNIQGLNTL